jgi:DNA gyrase subunit B
MAKTEQTSYGAKSIQVLEGLDPVRKRPGMYIGGTSLEGLHHLIWEVVNNSIDEAMAGHCTEITVRLLPDDWVEVRDNGRWHSGRVHPSQKCAETV